MDAKPQISYYTVVRRDDSSPSDPESQTWFQVLNLKEIDSCGWGRWIAKKTDDGGLLILDMPGVSKENVSVFVKNKKTLIIKGLADKESPEDDDDASVRSFIGIIDLPDNGVKISDIEAKMTNGLLKVKIPEMKPDQKTTY